jgi:hypothetical protein
MQCEAIELNPTRQCRRKAKDQMSTANGFFLFLCSIHLNKLGAMKAMNEEKTKKAGGNRKSIADHL